MIIGRLPLFFLAAGWVRSYFGGLSFRIETARAGL
jgi:hypothetical protein